MAKSYTTPEEVRSGLIGSSNLLLPGPFGVRPIVYADSTASGKALDFIEDYIRNVVLPLYANTHTEASTMGLQTSFFRESARRQIAKAVHVDPSQYAVIFTGTGVTGAINKFAYMLGISPLAKELGSKETERPVVFITYYEHHSNELLWRESNVDVVKIPEDKSTGTLDLDFLKQQLARFDDRKLRVASFSAASNVTGIRADVKSITKLVKSYERTLVAWDFAAAGPHVDINVEGADAIFLSTHKFPGGPSTPGILVAKRNLFDETLVPTVPGGGTVHFVERTGQRYIERPEEREEGGTPGIVESIRAGLVYDLHSKVGGKRIERIEQEYLKQALTAWKSNPNMVVLGNPAADRVSIVSFLIRAPDGKKFLHHNFCTALLNDLFGIQGRGGCSCAGPYGLDLLKISNEQAKLFIQELSWSSAGKPGWTRVSFSYYMSLETVKYIINAIDLTATHGYKLLKDYKMDLTTGQWASANPKEHYQLMDLWDLQSSYLEPSTVKSGSKAKLLKDALEHGRKVLTSEKPQKKLSEAIRWYALPDEYDENDARTYIRTRPPLHMTLESQRSVKLLVSSRNILLDSMPQKTIPEMELTESSVMKNDGLFEC